MIDRIAKIMSGALMFMGVLHFAVPKPFDGIVPKELPGDPRNYTYASGAAEFGIGAALVPTRTRRTAAALAAALFVAVFPANVNTLRIVADKGPAIKWISWLRLPLQLPMIAAAIAVWRGTPRTQRSERSATR